MVTREEMAGKIVGLINQADKYLDSSARTVMLDALENLDYGAMKRFFDYIRGLADVMKLTATESALYATARQLVAAALLGDPFSLDHFVG